MVTTNLRRSSRVRLRGSGSLRRSRDREGSPIPEDPLTNFTAIPQFIPTANPTIDPPFTGSPSSASLNIDSVHSPYHLTNSDTPGIAIIPEILDGNNYGTWSIAMKIALDAKNKLVFIDGSTPRPSESHPLFRIWSRCNSLVKSWILKTVSKQIYGSIIRLDDAYEIWKDLLTRFNVTNLPRTYQLSQQIWFLHQGSVDLATYYTTLKTLWDELDGADCVNTSHNYKCCKLMDTKLEDAKVIKFLAGLNESYAHVRSQIIMKKHIPEFAEIYNILDQDHNQRNLGSGAPTNVSAFQVSQSPDSTYYVNATQGYANHSRAQGRPVCSHCGFNGHTVDKCYKVHGYPPGFKHKSKNSSDKQVDSSSKPIVAQLALTETSSRNFDIPDLVASLSKNQIQDVIAYFSSHLPAPTLGNSDIPSASGTGNNGSFQGIEDWTG